MFIIFTTDFGISAPFLLSVQRIRNEPSLLPPRRKSRSQGWSGADRMQSLFMMVLTLHFVVCLFSQDSLGEVNRGWLQPFASCKTSQWVSARGTDLLDLFWAMRKVSAVATNMRVGWRNCPVFKRTKVHKLHQLRCNVTVVTPKHVRFPGMLKCLCERWCHLKRKKRAWRRERRQQKTV